MEKLVKRDSGSGGFSSLMSAVLEKQTLSAMAIWQVLLVAQETKTCPLNLLMEEIRREPGADAFFRAGRPPGLLSEPCPCWRVAGTLLVPGAGAPGALIPTTASKGWQFCLRTWEFVNLVK